MVSDQVPEFPDQSMHHPAKPDKIFNSKQDKIRDPLFDREKDQIEQTRDWHFSDQPRGDILVKIDATFSAETRGQIDGP